MFLTTRTRTRVPMALVGVLERLDAADVEADRGVELERPAARGHLGVAEHHAHFFPQLIDEDRRRLRLVDGAGQLAQRLTHQARLKTDVAVAHLALDLGPGGQGGHRVDDQDVERPAADEQFGDLERLLAGVGLREQQVVDLNPDAPSVHRVHGMLGVDERRLAPRALGLGDDVERERRLAAGLGPEDLDHPAPRHPTHTQRQVEPQRPGGDRRHLYGGGIVAHAHDRALAELTFDLHDRHIQRLVLLHDSS